MKKTGYFSRIIITAVLFTTGACVTHSDVYYDPNMDFSSIQTVAVLPFANLTRDDLAAARVRDVFITKLLSTGAVYILPPGEVARAVARAEISNPTTPSAEEVVKLADIAKVQAVITGVVREYGEVRSGTTSANIVSFSVQMVEGTIGKVIWSASSTKGGISAIDRLFGGGGTPMNAVTQSAVNDIVNKLLQ